MGLSCGSSSLSAMAFLSSLNLGDAKPRHVCPECKDSGYLERWGTEHGHRRWRCSRCGKTFSETLGTVQYRSRIGRLLVGIGSVLTAADMSVMALAATMGIDKRTALRYRHMMMAELSKRRLPDWLSGHAWVDGTFWPLPARPACAAGGSWPASPSGGTSTATSTWRMSGTATRPRRG